LIVLGSIGVGRFREAGTAVQSTDKGSSNGADSHGLDWLVARAAIEPGDLGDRHIGCQRLLRALVADLDEPAERFLRQAGTGPAAVHHAMRTTAVVTTYVRRRVKGLAVTDAMSGVLEEIGGRLDRLVQR